MKKLARYGLSVIPSCALAAAIAVYEPTAFVDWRVAPIIGFALGSFFVLMKIFVGVEDE
jgi:hypothetical protein